MPLKLTKRGRIYWVRGTVAGQACYETCGTTDAAAAETYRRNRETELWQRRYLGERAVVTFAEATSSYLEWRNPGPGERVLIKRILAHLGAKKTADINQSEIDRCLAAALRADAKASTRARMISPISAILTHAAKRGWCDRPALDKPSLPRQPKTRWLTPDEAQRLIAAAAPHLRPLLVFLLGTGARLSEAIELDWKDVDLPAAKVVFRDAKNGFDRPAGLPPHVVAALSAVAGREGEVFRKPTVGRDENGRPVTLLTPYADRRRIQGGQIKTAFRGACKRAGLGAWEGTGDDKRFAPSATPHDLRHTWATWFYAVTKDPLLLKREGGWRDLNMVERYAHLAPSSIVGAIATVWGPSHPAIGLLPIGAKSVQQQAAG